MIVDAQLQLSNAQALTATAFSTNTIDLANVTPARAIGAGEPMCLLVQVGVAADFTTTDETYRFDLVQSSNSDLSSPDVLESRVITAANLTAGSLHTVPIPVGAITKRYLGAQYTLGGTTPSVTVTTYAMPQRDVDAIQTYARGYTITNP